MRFRLSNLLLLLVTCTLICLNGQSQVNDTTINFTSPPSLPDSLANRDAVVLLDSSEIVYRISSFHNYSEMLLGIHSFHRQIKILTRKGLEDCSYVNIRKTRYTEIDKLEVFLIKPNGSIVKEKPQIIEVPDPWDDSNLQRGLLRFSIPGAEIGDIVDFTSKMTNPVGGGYPIDLFFHEDIPILNSTTTLRFKNTVRFQIKGYNGLQVECKQSGRSDSIFQWKFQYLPAIYGLETGIRENELPFCRYMITGVRITNSFTNITKLTPASWGAAFLPIIKGVTRSSPKEKKLEYFNELMARLLKGCDTCSKISGFYKVFSYIQDSVRLVETKKRENFSSGYYLWCRSIDRFSLFILYKDLFNYFGYPGYFVFARNKYSGMLDVNWITEEFYSDLYLAFKDENGTIHYIYPKTEYREFNIDEIDPDLMGTKAFLVNMENAFDYSELFLPAYGCEFNLRVQNTKVEMTGDLSIFRVTSKCQGGFSTLHRIRENLADKDSLMLNLKKNLEKKLENISIDSLERGKTNLFPPFDYTLTYKSSQSSKVVWVNDSVFTVNIGQWIDHDILSSDPEIRNLDYYTSFPYTEKLSVEYTFTSPVKLINERELNTICDNEIGTYSISARNSTANRIIIESTYCIKSFVLPALKYNLLKEINLRQRQFAESHLILEKSGKQKNN